MLQKRLILQALTFVFLMTLASSLSVSQSRNFPKKAGFLLSKATQLKKLSYWSLSCQLRAATASAVLKQFLKPFVKSEGDGRHPCYDLPLAQQAIFCRLC